MDVGSDPKQVPPELEDVAMDHPLVLTTVHRHENFGPGIEHIARGLRRLAYTHPEARIVYPVHLNPQVREPVFRLLGDVDNVSLIDPLPYPSLGWLLHRAHFVITDSGGLQEEAAGIGKARAGPS